MIDKAIDHAQKALNKEFRTLKAKDKVRDAACDRDHKLAQKIKRKTVKAPNR